MLIRVLGIIAMVLGVLGMLVSLILLWPIWTAHGATGDAVTSLTSSIEGGVQRIDERVSELETSVAEARTQVQTIADEAQSVAESTTVDQSAGTRLLARIDSSITPHYVRAREAYVAIRERIEAMIELIVTVERAFPSVDLPEPSRDNLGNIDNTMREVNATLTGLHTQLAEEGLPVTRVAQAVVTATERLDSRLEGVAGAVSSFRTELANTQASIASTRSDILGWLTMGAVVLSLLCIYLLLLHVSLFAHGLSWFRRPAKTEATASPIAPATTPT